ncbi:hypothetical protein BO99DRAFT_435314 [Aspergillus violaceofuscus CBS 115571]|uniref:Rhodopsin domain-containing protein n=1 Tax=Aspergillus violaceofuscus (strain CBS 115571) TaxID=1450538 RepID=A0A2V5HXI4_ASPV1|nr:hypothetical protein BO99DRAFT_435314 [Aspergillus violaceofuscus CBS 115571]
MQPGAKKKHVYLKSSPSPLESSVESSPRSAETSTLSPAGRNQARYSFTERAPAYTLLQRQNDSHNLVLSFLANCLPAAWSTAPSRSWITLLASLPTEVKALEVSSAALAAAAVGRRFNDPALVQYSHSLYTQGLQQLQRALWDRRLAQDDATLAACMALNLYEAMECPNAGSEGYFGHCQGLLVLVEARGIDAHCSGPGHQLFLGVRIPGIIYALENHSSSFLFNAAWMHQPWSQTPKTSFTQVVDCLAQAPGILQRVFLLPSLSPDQQVEACFQLIAECWQIDARLDTIYAVMQDGRSDPLYWPVASNYPSPSTTAHGQNLFPFVFHFADFETAATLILLWAVRVLLWSGLCNLYKGMFPTSCMLPADERVGPLRALGHRREYISMAHHVCHSVEYLMQDDFLLAGPLSVTPALGIVIDSLRYQPEHAAVVAWLRAALDLVRQKGLGVLEHSRVLRGIGRTSEEGGIDYDALGKIQLAVQVLYITSAALVKLSILFLYRQVFQHMRTIITITIAAIVVITVVFIFVAIFQRHPIGRFWWEPKAAQGACISHLIFWCDVAVVFLLSNIWITALPVRPILGLLTCSTATIRLAYVIKLYRGNDPTRDIVPIYFCSISEICVALVSLSIPSLRLAARRKWTSPAPC